MPMRHRPAYGLVEGGGSAALFAAASAALATGRDEIGVIAHCDVPMCVVDAQTPEMPVTFANDAFSALSGYGPEEIVGRNCRFLQGPETDPADVAKFRDGFATGRPFQVSIVNHRKDGEAFRNEVFISPVRDASGAVGRMIGMQVAVTPPGSAEIATAAALRHQFRNQVQTMTSLIALSGQRVPPGEGRDAFEDLRARVEAITIGQTEEFSVPGPIVGDRALSRLVDRIAQTLDPRGATLLAVEIAPFTCSAHRAATLAQIVAELMIDLFRNAMRSDGARGRVSVTHRADGGLRLEVASDGQTQPEPCIGSSDLGLAIVQSLARSLGGAFDRKIEGGLVASVTAPGEGVRH